MLNFASTKPWLGSIAVAHVPTDDDGTKSDPNVLCPRTSFIQIDEINEILLDENNFNSQNEICSIFSLSFSLSITLYVELPY